jgi:acetylornithine deacetylase
MTALTETKRQAIEAAVDAHRDKTVKLLLDLVGAPSVTGEEAPVQAVVAREFAQRGLTVDQWEATAEEIAPYTLHVGEQERYEGRPNVAGQRNGASEGRSLLLNAHIDTVAVGERSAWTHDPAGEVVDGRVYGRGSCDMKGGLATHLAALDALDAAGIALNGEVTLTATVGEENGGLGALSTCLRGYRADAALISEPTELALVRAQGGSLVFRLTVTGRSAHAAVRNTGVSALEKFVPILQDLQAFEAERNAAKHHPLYEGFDNKMPLNVGVVRTGVWASTVPETLEAHIRAGFLPGEDLETVQGLITDRIMNQADADRWLREHPPVIEWFGGQFDAAETPLDEPICRVVMTAHKEVTGHDPAIAGVTWGADMRLFQRFGGMPTVMYGAGDVNLAHAPDEWLPIDDLLTATKTIALLLCDWCGVAETK